MQTRTRRDLPEKVSTPSRKWWVEQDLHLHGAANSSGFNPAAYKFRHRPRNLKEQNPSRFSVRRPRSHQSNRKPATVEVTIGSLFGAAVSSRKELYERRHYIMAVTKSGQFLFQKTRVQGARRPWKLDAGMPRKRGWVVRHVRREAERRPAGRSGGAGGGRLPGTHPTLLLLQTSAAE